MWGTNLDLGQIRKLLEKWWVMTVTVERVDDYDLMPKALAILLRGLHYPAEARSSICASFDLAARAMRAARLGILLLRHEPEGIRAEVLYSKGFTMQELRGIECQDQSLAGNHPLVLEMIAQAGSAAKGGESLRPFAGDLLGNKVLAIPISDPILDIAVAILYLEREGSQATDLDAQERDWIESFRLALGQILHMGFERSGNGLASAKALPKLGELGSATELVGDSLATQALRKILHEVYIPAASNPDPDPILILGEKGTGKDLVARYIYAYSARANFPYVALNCAEITDELAAARLFGHKRGSFTGSLANEPGLFRAADRGVLFLDEIGDLSLRSQAALLRVLENRTVVPLGETKEIKVDVQVILATNCDPERAVAEGRIRADLLDRFRTEEIRLVPLCERPWDIPTLIEHFMAHHQKRTQKRIRGLHPDVLRAMVGYSWPGNVRELARVCSLLVTHTCQGTLIDMPLLRRLLPHVAEKERNPKAGAMLLGDVPMREALETFGRELILARLKQHNWNVRSARESLGLPKTTFHRYTRALGISSSLRSEGGHLGTGPAESCVTAQLGG